MPTLASMNAVAQALLRQLAALLLRVSPMTGQLNDTVVGAAVLST